MVLECPHCNARLNAAAMPSPDRPVRCSKCKQVFTPAPPEESLPAAAAGGDDSDWSNMAASTPVETEKKTRATPTPAKKFPTLLVAGAGVGLLAVVGGAIAIAVFAFGDKSKQQNADANQSGQPATTKKDVTPRGASPKNVPQARPQVPVEYTDLFKETTDRPVRIPILKKIDAGELLAPGFAFVSEAAPSAGKRSKDEVVAEIKKSTALIETHLPDGSGGSGSGFVIAAGRDGILVATNFHVVGKMNAGLLAGTQIAAVFDSGLPTQKAYLAKVMASDPEADLAILKVPPFEPLPKPIDPNHAPKLVEAMDVYICGFPLGNPSFSIGNGTVLSIRREKGKISAVQINGAINHGNSGGPIVDTEGRLVGIAHVRVLDLEDFQGTGLGLAIPAQELTDLMMGRIFPPAILPVPGGDGQATFQVIAARSDPLGKVKEAILHVWSGDVAAGNAGRTEREREVDTRSDSVSAGAGATGSNRQLQAAAESQQEADRAGAARNVTAPPASRFRRRRDCNWWMMADRRQPMRFPWPRFSRTCPSSSGRRSLSAANSCRARPLTARSTNCKPAMRPGRRRQA